MIFGLFLPFSFTFLPLLATPIISIHPLIGPKINLRALALKKILGDPHTPGGEGGTPLALPRR